MFIRHINTPSQKILTRLILSWTPYNFFKKCIFTNIHGITFKNLSFGYTKNQLILQNISLTFPKGSFIGILQVATVLVKAL